MIGPDATVTLDFALARLAGVIDKLVVYPENMHRNLDRLGGLVHSQRVLLALTQKGVSREDAYRSVQRNAMKAWRGEGDFLTLLKADPDVAKALCAEASSRTCSTSAITSSMSTRSSTGCSARIDATRLEPTSASPRILVFDSGPRRADGAARDRARAARCGSFVYVADDAFFPYGAHEEPTLIAPRRAADRRADRRRTRRTSWSSPATPPRRWCCRTCASAIACRSSAPCRRSSRPAPARTASASRCSAPRRP